MSVREWIAAGFMLLGAFFFLAGTVGLLRFPDVYSRLHALTKADTLGLGLIAAGLALHAGSPSVALKLLLTWGFVILASASSCYLIAQYTLRGSSIPKDDDHGV